MAGTIHDLVILREIASKMLCLELSSRFQLSHRHRFLHPKVSLSRDALLAKLDDFISLPHCPCRFDNLNEKHYIVAERLSHLLRWDLDESKGSADPKQYNHLNACKDAYFLTINIHRVFDSKIYPHQIYARTTKAAPSRYP